MISYHTPIQPELTRPKWNMGEIFGLKFHLPYLNTSHRLFFEIPPCGEMVIFVTEFGIFSEILLSMK
jgi:hypothetical protein